MPTTDGRLERAGATLRWWLSTEREDAPLVVLVHGGAMDHRMWDSQVAELARDYRMLALDLRGHGESTCDASEFSADSAAGDVAALLDGNGPGRAVLVGHSFGGTVVQLVALKRPERVRGLVGIGAACATMRPTVTARARQALNPVALSVLGQERVRAMFADMAGATSDVREYARGAVAALNDEMFAAVMRTGFGRPVQVDAGYRLGVPLLLLQGEKEPYSAFLGRTHAWVERDGGQLVIVPGAAHNANQDSPEFVSEQLRRFLAALPPG